MPDEDGLGHELDAEAVVHSRGDLPRERDELRGRTVAAVRQRERVLARDRDGPWVAVAALEARALDHAAAGIVDPAGRRAGLRGGKACGLCRQLGMGGAASPGVGLPGTVSAVGTGFAAKVS